MLLLSLTAPFALARSAASRLRAGNLAALLIVLAWAAAIALDAFTTLRMNGAGFEEANPIMAPFMQASFPLLPVAAASFWAALLGFISAGKPTNLPQRTIVVGLWIVLGLKIIVGASNLTLFITDSGLPWQ